MTTYNIKDISGVKFDGIDHNDAPDYCDAYITEAYNKGLLMTEEEIDELNEDDDLNYSLLMSYLY